MSQISTILVPVDFSEGSQAAVDEAMTVARAFGASIELLHVWQLPIFVAPDMMLLGPNEMRATIADYARNRAAQELEALETSLKDTGVPVTGTLMMADPATAIIERAAGADLVVMGTRGRTGISRWLIGSVAEKVVRRSPTPVLTVHEKTEAMQADTTQGG